MTSALALCIAATSVIGPTLAYDVQDWATPAWQEWAAHIVASEARGVPQADIVVACTMVRDVERGWHPWALRSRWFGWGTPDDRDRAAVGQALNGGCSGVPDYAHVGNFQDAQYWRMRGYFDGRADLYLGEDGAAVVGVPWRIERSSLPTSLTFNLQSRYTGRVTGCGSSWRFPRIR